MLLTVPPCIDGLFPSGKVQSALIVLPALPTELIATILKVGLFPQEIIPLSSFPPSKVRVPDE